ncbi:transmembrane protein 69 [Nematolebias whitei]|uniref:transmembrane protein 69 n=1 Tax=Nematolebias whitei TaxID=451745 RepID=UPI00189855FA|nr:transmembrane protein 69 [Nematolebias whitei]
MLSAVLRSTFAAQRVLQRAHPPQRCWTSVLTGASGGSASCSSKRDTGQLKSHCLSGLFQRTQTHNALFEVRNQYVHCSAVRLKKRAPPEPLFPNSDLKHLFEGPKPALILGFAGMIPFVSSILIISGTETYYPQLHYAQVAYAASMISFLGGARWGFALPESSPAKPDWINLSNSVVPCLLGCITMLMTDNIAVAATMAVLGFGIALHYDVSLLPTYPSWFKAIRIIMTIVAFCSLVLPFLLLKFFPEKNPLLRTKGF